MALKAVLDEDQFGELDEASKELYVGRDGSYVLDLDGVDDHPQVRALKGGHNRSKQERDEARSQFKALKRKFGALADIEDLDLSDADEERFNAILPYLRGEAELPDFDGEDDDKRKPKVQPVDLEKIKSSARKPLERDIADLTEERDGLRKELDNFVRSMAVSNALAAIGVTDPDYREMLTLKFEGMAKVTRDDDGKPLAVIDGEYGEWPVEKHLKEWATTDAAKKFTLADGNGGGGVRSAASPGGKTKNPWAKEHWSATEQARIYRDDPARAKRMAAEHGKKVL